MSLKCIWYAFFSLTVITSTSGEYKIGVGIGDCTGPAAEVTFMGYGKTTQKGCGIHLRQFSRAFVFGKSEKRVVFVSVDAGMMSFAVHKAVMEKLRPLYNGTYNEKNVILSGTHTHSAPGGFLMNFMYEIPNLGFINETFNALVDGITKSIVKAHESMVDGNIFLTFGDLHDANINRSPMSYLQNPKEERAKYQHNVDKEMVQLQLKTLDGALIGVINWFAVHPTSMNNTNCLITSDNVGYASVLLEKSLNKNSLVGQGRIVTAFASTNLGDVSPNTRGPRCVPTGEECDVMHSSCDSPKKFCIASGPGRDMFESTQIIAEKLFEKAKILLSTKGRQVRGDVNFVQKYVDMPSEKTTIVVNGTEKEVHGCLPAMGYSFAAGTTDGLGEDGFSQATKTTNSYWNTVRDLLFQPTEDDIRCHHPKPILINSGRIGIPYQWQPRIVSTQLLQLGDVILVAVPGEFTTMSGRRLREAVADLAAPDAAPKVIIAGLSNAYSSYIATPEEYQLQRYEGASTVYGPHTLDLYLNIYRKLADALFKGNEIDQGPSPPDLASKVVSLLPAVMFDTSGFVNNFGDCLIQPPKLARKGSTVYAKFVSGHPRNDPLHGGTFLTVEKLSEKNWIVVATDADWETKFLWKRTATLTGGSEATVSWDIPEDAAPGIYRLRHFGTYKSIFGGIWPYNGTSNSFRVIQ